MVDIRILTTLLGCRATRNKVSLVLMLLMLVGVIALMIYELLTRE
jgi:hypothetical protein